MDNDHKTSSDQPACPSFRPLNKACLTVVTLLYSAAAVALVAWSHSKCVFVAILWITVVFGPGGLYACRTLSDALQFFKSFWMRSRSIVRYFYSNIFSLMLFGLTLRILQLLGII